MALLFSQPLGKRHPAQKRRRPPVLRRWLLRLTVFCAAAVAYWLMAPDALRRRVFGGSREGTTLTGAMGGGAEGAGVAGDSRVRIRRLAPEKWGTEDVGVWLQSEGLGQLRGRFKRHKVNGPALLSLDPRRLMRELAVNDDAEVARVLEAVRILKHVAFTSHSWKDVHRPPGTTSKTVDLYLVGENMWYDKKTQQKRLESGVEPAASVSIAGVRLLRDVVARASKALNRPVRELVAPNGELIVDLTELPPKVYALCEADFFVYPTEFPGFKQVVALPSAGRWSPGISMVDYEQAAREQPPRTVEVEVLSTEPRVLLVENFISAVEAEHIIAMAQDKMDRSMSADASSEALVCVCVCVCICNACMHACTRTWDTCTHTHLHTPTHAHTHTYTHTHTHMHTRTHMHTHTHAHAGRPSQRLAQRPRMASGRHAQAQRLG